MAGLRNARILAVAAALAAGSARAAVKTETVPYKDGDTVLNGFLAYDDAVSGRRPGVLVIHEWWGLNDYAKRRARQLAGMGYVAFACDMYGDGKVGATRQEASALAGRVRGTPAMRRRAVLALDVLKKDKRVDPDRCAAIGFCFGGSGVLELARTGADLKGVVSFHGGLTTKEPADPKTLKAAILVLHGADDRNAPAETLEAFRNEMRKAKADWQLVLYGNAVHAFSNPDAGHDPSRGAAYDEKAARRSWALMTAFFREIFATKGSD